MNKIKSRIQSNFYLGELRWNQSKKYLKTILEGTLPSTFMKEFNKIFPNKTVNGWFYKDVQYYSATKDTNLNLLFCVVDINGIYLKSHQKYVSEVEGRRNFYNFLKYFRNSRYYYYDYPLEDLRNIQKHCLVFDLSFWKEAYEYWKEGKFSKMLSHEEMKKLGISNKSRNVILKDIYKVITLDNSVKYKFENKVNQRFKTNWKIPKDYKGELDYIPLDMDEILNYEKEEN